MFMFVVKFESLKVCVCELWVCVWVRVLVLLCLCVCVCVCDIFVCERESEIMCVRACLVRYFCASVFVWIACCLVRCL